MILVSHPWCSAIGTNSIAQGDLEHQCAKCQFFHTGKKKDTRNVSLSHQEVIKQFIVKVNSARDSLLAAEASAQPKQPPHLQTSPKEHYYIAASTWQSHDLTEWLRNLRDNPAVKVCFMLSNFLYAM